MIKSQGGLDTWESPKTQQSECLSVFALIFETVHCIDTRKEIKHPQSQWGSGFGPTVQSSTP